MRLLREFLLSWRLNFNCCFVDMVWIGGLLFLELEGVASEEPYFVVSVDPVSDWTICLNVEVSAFTYTVGYRSFNPSMMGFGS